MVIYNTSRPDGYTTEFFKKHWNIVKDVSKGCSKTFLRKPLLMPTFIRLIFAWLIRRLMQSGLVIIIDWSAMPHLFKIIAQVLSETLKGVVPHTIARNKFAFVANCRIIDASLIATELIDPYFLSKTKGMVKSLTLRRHLIWLIGNFLTSWLSTVWWHMEEMDYGLYFIHQLLHYHQWKT